MNASTRQKNNEPSALREALWAQRGQFTKAGWYSFASGLALLTPSWFMLEVYGRVLNSRNLKTLLMLAIVVIGIYVAMELLDLVRSRYLRRAAAAVDARLRSRLFDASYQANLRRPSSGHVQAFADLKTLRDFIPSQAVTAVMDIPAALIFLLLLFAISPWLGVMALVGAGLQVMLAGVTERHTVPLLGAAGRAQMDANQFATNALRNAPVVESMGMLQQLHARWIQRQRKFIGSQSEASDVAGFTTVAAKLIQSMQASLLLGAACWLAIQGDLIGGGGMMIVASILGARVLTPLWQLVASWRLVVGVREAWSRLDTVFSQPVTVTNTMRLPPPKGVLTVEHVMAGAPGSNVPILRGVRFAINAGEVLGVIGPSASGKSTLARVLMGIWPTQSGKVRLDGIDVHGWNKAELGPHVGYLPQNVELFDGTVAENIARFGGADPDGVREAARQVGILETIEAMPQGFDTRIGNDGAVLSGGNRQRVGLARAIYGEPKFIVLDEPNASLDEAGEKALVQLIASLKARGCTVVLITHRSTLLAVVDKLLVMAEGAVAIFAPRDEALAALAKANAQARAGGKAPAAPLGGAPARPALPAGGAA